MNSNRQLVRRALALALWVGVAQVPSGASGEQVGNYGYTGREPDASGLEYYRGRYYDAVLGRFSQRDPIGLAGGINDYAYVEGNPVNALDPSGTSKEPTVLDTMTSALEAACSYFICPADAEAADKIQSRIKPGERIVTAHEFADDLSRVNDLLPGPLIRKDGGGIIEGGRYEMLLERLDALSRSQLTYDANKTEEVSEKLGRRVITESSVPKEIDQVIRYRLDPVNIPAARHAGVPERWAATVLDALVKNYKDYRVLLDPNSAAANIRSNNPYNEPFNSRLDWRKPPKGFK